MNCKHTKPFLLFVDILCVLLVLLLTACGGSSGNPDNNGGNGTNEVFSLSTDVLNFQAETPSVWVDSQDITGTITASLSGILYIVVDVQGESVSRVSDFTINQFNGTGTATVVPASAAELGVGTHTATITVRACINDSTCNTGELSGSPKTIHVTYTVDSPVKADTIMPNVSIAGQSGEAIIRGHNFTSNNINAVSFGTDNALSFEVISDTEIHVTYPALTQGNYPVQLTGSSGPVSFSASLQVRLAQTFTAGTLSYPTAPQQTLALIYDASRDALLVAASYFDGDYNSNNSRTPNQILRYQFSNGEFVSMDSVNVPLLRDMALSPNAQELLALTDDSVVHLDPESLIELQESTNTHYDSGDFAKNFVITNEGSALITAGYDGSGAPATYLYPLNGSDFYRTTNTCTVEGTPGVSADGAYAAIVQGGLSPTPPVCEFDASTSIFSETVLHFNQRQCTGTRMGMCLGPVISKNGALMAVIDRSFIVSIYDRDYALLGQLPDSHGAIAFGPSGTRIYTYDANGTLRTFALDLAVVDGIYTEIGSAISLAGNPGIGVSSFPNSPTEIVKMITTPDGNTVFIAGGNEIAIQPAP